MQNKKKLSIQNVSFAFKKQESPFFENISSHFNTGEIHFIRGANGVGKSVFFNILRGDVKPEALCSGTFNFDTITIQVSEKKPFTPAYKNLFAFVHQDCDSMLAGQLTVEQNLRCANIPKYPRFSRLPEYRDLGNFMDTFGIDAAKPVHLLSGGQRQIVAIMMALQKNARIILLDEPTAALDEKNADMVIQFLETLAKTTEVTALIICHDKELVMRYAHDAYYTISFREGKTRTLEKIML